MVSILDCYKGSLVGVLCGDALGAPYETWTEDRILADINSRGGLVLFDYDDPWGKDGRFPAGRPTDDSEMTAALAEYLVHGGGPEKLYALFRKCVIDKKSFLCDLPAYGFGGTTRNALAQPTYLEALANPDPNDPIPSNGSLMRAAPIALLVRGQPVLVRELAEMQALMTHRHPEAIAATVAYSLILDHVLDGFTYKTAVKKTLELIPLNDGYERIAKVLLRGKPKKPQPPTHKFRGGAVYSLRVVHWAVSTSSSFEEGIFKAVTIGGDTDTYAAIAGGMLGAMYGVHAIPEKWSSGLLGRARMCELAAKLCELNVRR
ncbi:MAG: ADP-ribosylglycohydrolase [Parcubacteria bacterium C7867-001]|nr:MAG: ADP-ribosylglycohydrolase [Parcubacteria bacterium C7867-001]